MSPALLRLPTACFVSVITLFAIAVAVVPAQEPGQLRGDYPAIWHHGIEDHLEADVYPSKKAAMRSLGLRIARPVQTILGSETTPNRIILFRGNHDHDLLAEFTRAVASYFPPDVECVTEPESAPVEANEVGIRLDLSDVTTTAAPWPAGGELAAGTLQATVLGTQKEATAKVKFVEKPWMEDFASLVNADPRNRFLIARSQASCTSQAQANHQAIDSACTQLTQTLAETTPRYGPRFFAHPVTAAELLDGGLVVDRFVQSFKSKTGRIWRQALLIDASRGKIAQLAAQKVGRIRTVRRIWMRMFISTVGLLILITAVYAFLNMATKGYYVWSLRITGITIALIGIVVLILLTA